MAVNIYGYRTDPGLQIINVRYIIVDAGVGGLEVAADDYTDTPEEHFTVKWLPAENVYLLQGDERRFLSVLDMGIRLVMCKVLSEDSTESSMDLTEFSSEDLPE